MISLGRLGISRRLLAVNALLAALSVGFSIYIIGQMTSSPGAPVPARAVTAAAAVDPSAGAPVQPSPGIYSMIGIRNLFSPTRLDTATAGTAVAPAGVRLNLFGVVLAGDRSIAYLEDPVSKRVYGYRLGDSVAGGVIRAIEADRIVLERVKQTLDVRLHDPSRARRNLAAASAGVDGSSAAATPDRPADAQAPAMPPVP